MLSSRRTPMCVGGGYVGGATLPPGQTGGCSRRLFLVQNLSSKVSRFNHSGGNKTQGLFGAKYDNQFFDH